MWFEVEEEDQLSRRQQPSARKGCWSGTDAIAEISRVIASSILVNHEAEAARGALAFDHAGQAARLKSPRPWDGANRLKTEFFLS
jgi:hypothetical protein